MKLTVADEWVERNVAAGLITDPKEAYLASTEDSDLYFAALDVAKEAAGFTGLAEGECPLLIAENQTRLAARQVIDSSVYMTGKSFNWHDLLCSGLDNYKEFVDLAVMLVISLCPDINPSTGLSVFQTKPARWHRNRAKEIAMSMTSYIGRVRIDHINVRPDVPTDWLIMNAPRPLYGTKTRFGYGPEGSFTVAIDPSDEQAAWMIKENRGLDACTVLYISDEQLFQIGFACYAALASSEEMISQVVKYVIKDDRCIGDHGLAMLLRGINKGE
jgi:hypothetical protein